MPDFTIRDGFPERDRDDAARLFWAAFEGKLGGVLKPQASALRLLSETVDPTHAIGAFSCDGRLLGVAGYMSARGAFLPFGADALVRIYGLIGGLGRGLLLSTLRRRSNPGVLLMEGIFVDDAARGSGVGSALLAAIKAKAAELGCSSVRLDVVDTNPRARALYERQGFAAGPTQRLGPLSLLFGFRAATTMVHRLALSGR